MKVTIIRMPLNHLWNTEYCMLVSKIVAVFLQFNVEGLHLKKAFERLTALMPQIAQIKAQELSNALTNKLADLNSERHTLIVAIMDQVSTYGKLSIPSTAPHVALLNRFFDKHGRDIGDTNYNVNTKRFSDMLTEYYANQEIQIASAALLLTVLFDHLNQVNTQFDTLFMERSSQNSAVQSVDARAIRAETDKALIAFFNAFEFCSTEYEDLDYKAPADKLNEYISGYKTQLKARTTRRHEGKEVHTEAPIEVA